MDTKEMRRQLNKKISQTVRFENKKTLETKLNIGLYLMKHENIPIEEIKYEWSPSNSKARVDVAHLTKGTEPHCLWEIGCLEGDDNRIAELLSVCDRVFWVPDSSSEYILDRFNLNYHLCYVEEEFEKQKFVVQSFKLPLIGGVYMSTSDKTLAKIFGLVNESKVTVLDGTSLYSEMYGMLQDLLKKKSEETLTWQEYSGLLLLDSELKGGEK